MKNELGKEFYSYATKHHGISDLNIQGYITPNIIEERQMNVAIMSVYDRLLIDRILFLGAGINADVANIIIAQLLFMESADSKKDIQLMVHSPGGSCNAGMAIINTMEYISCNVSTTVVGMAASMGSVIASAGAKGKRFALRNSRIMIHQVSSGSEGRLTDMEIALKEAQRVKFEIYTELAKNTGKSYETIEKDAEKDYWMSADEAKEYGMIDDVMLRSKVK